MAINIDVDLCKSCSLCKRICPKDVFEKSGKVNKKGYEYMSAARPENCIKCKTCENICPDFAISVD